jgi:hypothetical protein
MLSTILTTRLIHPPTSFLRIQGVKIWRQIAFGLIGLPLAFLVFQIAPHKPLVPTGNLVEVLIGIVSLVIFNGFLEEYIFRYLIQTNLDEIFGWVGIWIGGALFAGMYIGVQSLPLMAFWGLVGICFGYWVKFTDSIWGVVLAHSLLLVTALILLSLMNI